MAYLKNILLLDCKRIWGGVDRIVIVDHIEGGYITFADTVYDDIKTMRGIPRF